MPVLDFARSLRSLIPFALIVLVTCTLYISHSEGRRSGHTETLSDTSLVATAPSNPPADFIVTAERSIVEREYEVSGSGEGLQSPNRAQNFRTYFESWGVRVVDRTAKGSPELFQMKTVGVGRKGRMAALVAGKICTAGARVENRHGEMVEWYVNDELGLEHGYVLDQRPAGEGSLLIDIVFDGANVSVKDGRAVIEAVTGRRLEYGNLAANDATNRQLTARIEPLRSDAVRLVIEDDGAIFPLMIDPLLTSTADATLEADQANAFLGFGAAGAGDVNGDGYADVIVGAYYYDAGQADEGAAFVFHGGPTGITSGTPATANATLQSDQVSVRMGYSVAGAGDVNGDGYADVIVGAYRYDAGEVLEGAAFVFHGGPTGITSGNPSTANAILRADQADANMGFSVVGAGDVNKDGYADVIVGANRYSSGGTSGGAAFVFHGGPSGIASGTPATANAALESFQQFSQMGATVAGAGDVNGDGYSDVIVGAPSYAIGQMGEGAAFVFYGGPMGVTSGHPGTANATLQSDQANAQLGIRVAGADDVNGDGYADVIVGAWQYDAGQTDEGAAFVFHGGPSGITSGNPATANATLQSDQANAWMGYGVAGAGDVNGDGYADVIVGAIQYDAGQTDEGVALVFYGGSEGVTSRNPAMADATLQTNQSGDWLGSSVSSAGDVNGDGYADVIVGAVNYYSTEQVNEGAAFVYLGGAEGVRSGSPTAANATLQSDQADAQLGFSVAGAGDVNGDGYSDVIVGVRLYDAGQVDEGAAFVFHGGATGITSGIPTTANAMMESDQVGARLGHSVAGAGDVNGDGYADVIVGAEAYDAGQTNEGAAFIFYGGPSGILSGNPSTANVTLQSDQASAELGHSVAGAGDVNGDGYADVIIGVVVYDAGQVDEGAAFVFHGGPLGIMSGNPTTANATLESDQANAFLGQCVAGAGDVNGDGYADVIVGASGYDAEQIGEGAAFVFHGGPSGITSGNPSTANATIVASQANAVLGNSVAGAGDVNGDGYADVIIGAVLYDEGQVDEGAAFVFHGGPLGIMSGNPTTANATLESDQANAFLGQCVAGAGDVNGDGYADVIVGAVQYDAGQVDEGAAFVFHGGPSGITSGNPATANATIQSDQFSAFLGHCVAGVGDVNGDGYADVIAGAFRYDAAQTDGGAVFVFYGNGDGFGRSVRARQLRGNGDTTNVEPWGSSVATDFQIRMTATHPAGRGRVKLQVEACPLGENWGGPNCVMTTSTTWTDVTATSAGATLTETISDLDPSTLYRWRARVLYGQYSTGTTAVNPSHGPWRRVIGQAVESDIRTGNPCILSCPGNVSVVAQNASGSLVNYTTPMATGGCSGATVSCIPTSGSIFPIGTTTVTCGAPSVGVNATECSFLVTVSQPRDTVGVVNSGSAWFLANNHGNGVASLTFFYGLGSDIPLAGDWDGDGDDTVGVYRPSTSEFFLKNSNANGGADILFQFGAPGFGFVPITGDWDGDGDDTIGLYQPSTGAFFIRNANAAGDADLIFFFGPAGANFNPLVGDWDGDGADGIGLENPNIGSFQLKNAVGNGPADIVFFFGAGGQGYQPVIGDWDNDGVDGIGLYVPSVSAFFLRNALSSGSADTIFFFGQPNSTPRAGNWDGVP